MSSINGLRQVSLPYQSLQLPIDNDRPRRNPLDNTAGDDAEFFDPNTQSWQATKALGEGRFTHHGDPYREPIDFEMRANRW